MANDVNTDVVVKYQSTGADQVNEDLKNTQAGLEGVSVSASGTEKATLSVENRFKSLERQLGTVSGNQAKFQQAQDTINRALAQNPELQERATAAMSAAELKYGGISQALEKYRNELEKTASVQKTINASTGVSGLSDSAARGADIVAYGKQLDDLRAKYNPLFAAGREYKSTLTEINQAVKVGALTEAEAAAAIARTKSAFADQVTATRGLAEAHGNLNAQGQAALHSIRSMVEQIALGASPVQALTAQMNHLSFAASGEGGIAGAFKQAGGIFGSMAENALKFITPVNLATAGMVAFGVAAVTAAMQFSNAQKAIETSLLGMGARSGATASSLKQFSEGGGLTGLSVGQRQEVGTEFTRSGLDASKIKDVTDAVQAYSIITGKNATEATKSLAAALSGDLSKGVRDLSQVFGQLDPELEDTVKNFELQGKHGEAVNAVIAALKPEIDRAKDSLGPLAKGWEAVGNAASIAANALAKVIFAEGEAGRARQAQRESAAQAAGFAQQDALTRKKGADVVNQYLPEIQQVEKLKQALADLQRAKQGVGATGPLPPIVDPGAEDKIRNLIAATDQALAHSERYQTQVAAISEAWKGVGQETAIALQAQENNLVVVQAVGDAQKMSAQYAADYANAINQGYTATEATAIAAMNLATSMARAKAQAEEVLFNLENQARASAAVTEKEKQKAEAAATYNKLLHDGVDALTAQQVAAQQLANVQAAANASIQRQVKDLERSTELIKAQMQGNASQVLAAQAYDKAIESGANAQTAAALQAATLANEEAKAAYQAYQLNKNAEKTADQTKKTADQAKKIADQLAMASQYMGELEIAGAKTTFNQFGVPYAPDYSKGAPVTGMFDLSQWTGTTAGSIPTILTPNGYVAANSPQAMAFAAAQQKGTLGGATGQVNFGEYIDTIIKSGGIQAGLRTAMAQPGTGSPYGTEADIESTVQSLYDTINQTADKATQASNIQAELQWLQSRPASAAQQSAIAQLKQSLDNLTKSTDSLNATNQDLLSPYYTQDPRTSHIGFRSQGMAQGGYVDVPGATSANDNMIATVPVASGERIYIDPMYSRRGLSAGANFTINVSSPVLFAGNPNKDEVGRTMYQNNQNLVKQLRSAMQ